MRTSFSAALASLTVTSFTFAQYSGPYVNFESPQTNSIRLSADGTRLFAANTADSRLSVFDISHPSNPVLLAEIPVGIEPVSVNPRTNDEVWVVNHTSDSVSIVSLSQGIVMDTIQVKDEPCDVVFAGAPVRAFVTAARSNQVRVFDITTHAQLASISLTGENPRALAASADGSKVYVTFALSGNRSTLVPAASAPPPPQIPGLPPTPLYGLIVDVNDPVWNAVTPWQVPDHDVAEINANTNTLTRYYDRAGTNLLGIAVRPTTGDLYITNIEARNLIALEANLKGHFVDNRVTKIVPTATPTVTPFDLNPGLNYNNAALPDDTAKASALAMPAGIVFDPSGSHMWIAAMGTDRIARVDPNGNITARIDIGPNAGAATDSSLMRGPRGLALNAGANRLYVQNRVSNTIAVVDTANLIVIQEVPAGSYDPTPSAVKNGRGYLYDAKLSGNGHASCASCHIDGEMDFLAWDLGDINATSMTLVTDPKTGTVFAQHPLKGPMTTQPLKNLANRAPYHWLGDKVDLNAFNAAFEKLMSGSQLSEAEMQEFVDFQNTMVFEPNPNLNLDNTYPATVNGGNPSNGLVQYQQVPNPGGGPQSCVSCHQLPGQYQPFVTKQGGDPIARKVPNHQHYYKKSKFNKQPAFQNTIGFGLEHDGAIVPAGVNGGTNDIGSLFLCFDTGMKPAVGYTRTVLVANANDPSVAADINVLLGQAAAGNCDVIGKGRVDGLSMGLLYNTASAQFVTDRAGVGPYSWAELQAKAASGAAIVSIMGVPPGSGTRMGIDRDLDGVLDGDEPAILYLSSFGASTPGCAGRLVMGANSLPFLGNELFGLTTTNAPASSLGLGLVGDASDAIGAPLLGITLHISLASLELLAFDFYSDDLGFGIASVGIPNDPSLNGRTYYGQSLWLSACGAQGLASSDALSVLLFIP